MGSGTQSSLACPQSQPTHLPIGLAALPSLMFIALALSLTSGRCNPVGEYTEFPYQVQSQFLVLCMLVGALTKLGMTYPQPQLLLAGVLSIPY